MEHVERSAIQEALAEAKGNRTKAAAILQKDSDGYAGAAMKCEAVSDPRTAKGA